jgi:hypothetical protein
MVMASTQVARTAAQLHEAAQDVARVAASRSALPERRYLTARVPARGAGKPSGDLDAGRPSPTQGRSITLRALARWMSAEAFSTACLSPLVSEQIALGEPRFEEHLATWRRSPSPSASHRQPFGGLVSFLAGCGGIRSGRGAPGLRSG